MTRTEGGETVSLPLDGTAELATVAEPSDVTTVFELLSDDTRRQIVRVLTERTLSGTGRPVLPFSDLKDRVGVRDGGRFNYHLKRLCGTLVEETDGGYGLTTAGFVFGWLFFHRADAGR